MDEDINDPDGGQENNRTNNRIRDLAEKLTFEKLEKERLVKEKELETAEKVASQKEVEFYKGFNTLAGKYSEAGAYQDKIREKVLSGYDIEDATISVLAKEGKLTTPQAPREMPAGGSATNVIPAGGEKTMSEMNSGELRAKLLEAEARGDISMG